MHKSPTLVLITAKKSAMGAEHPDYSGKMGGARVIAADDMPGSPCDMADAAGELESGPDMPADYRTTLADIKKELEKASGMHAKQAERIGKLLDGAENGSDSPGPDAEGDDEGIGEKRELT